MNTNRPSILRSRQVAGAVALALLLAACGGADDATTDGTIELAPDETTTTTTPAHAALAETLLEDVPPDFQLDTFSSGPVDMEEAEAWGDERRAERKRLEEAGFERGFVRRWQNTTGGVINVGVWEMADEASAQRYHESTVEHLTESSDETFDVPDVAGAHGSTVASEDEFGSFNAHTVVFPRGDRWYRVLVASEGEEAATPDDARGLAVAQADRIARVAEGGEAETETETEGEGEGEGEAEGEGEGEGEGGEPTETEPATTEAP